MKVFLIFAIAEYAALGCALVWQSVAAAWLMVAFSIVAAWMLIFKTNFSRKKAQSAQTPIAHSLL